MEIRKMAYEYAKSGEHQGWLSIEHRITAEGFLGANSELDVQYIRDELISLCQKANSSEEVTRRNQFQIWLEETVRDVAPILNKSKPEVYLTARNKILYISGRSFSFEIRRRFYSNELEMMKEFEDIQNILRKEKLGLAEKYKVKKIGIFGSYVRGEQQEESDIDILIDFYEYPSLLEFVGIEQELSDKIGKKVDLVMKTGLKPRIGQQILSEVVYV